MPHALVSATERIADELARLVTATHELKAAIILGGYLVNTPGLNPLHLEHDAVTKAAELAATVAAALRTGDGGKG